MKASLFGFGVALLLVSASACAPVSRGRFDASGYENTLYQYRVRPSPATGKLLGDGWWLDNYFEQNGKMAPKTSAAYKTKYLLDSNGDGATDVRESALLYDLRFKHRQRDAVIMLRTFPIDRDQKDKDLRVMMQGLVDEVAGGGYEAVTVQRDAPTDPKVRVEEKRYAATIVDRGEATLAQQPAYWATVDLANVDQLRLTPDARRVRIRAVLAKTPYAFQATMGSTGNKGGPAYPVLMLAEYISLPEDFDKDLPEFDDFLQRVAIAGVAGYAAAAAPAPVAASTAPTAPAAVPAMPAASAAPATVAPAPAASAPLPAAK
ncbi:MAG: hypothetical protein QM756_06695 [Polyangiaceae bacterium]